MPQGRLRLRATLLVLSFAGALFCTPLTFAGAGNDVPSCYAANKLPLAASPAAQDVTILIDQTTLFDSKLKKAVLENTWNLIGPDTSFSVIAFSAFSQGRYTEVVAAGRVEPPFPATQRDSTSERLLASLDQCLNGQQAFARKHAVDAIGTSLSEASAGLAKSDILAALKDVSARVKAASAKDKIVFVVSDMLENSSVSSFYASNTKARGIDPVKEMLAAEKANMLGDFGHARVFVLGAGLIGPAGDGKATYRDPRTMASLQRFWTDYFERSSATVIEFGQPALLQPVR